MKKIVFCILFLLSLSGCSRSPVLFKEARIAMDTFAEISVYSADRDSAHEAIRDAFREIERIEKVFNRFDSASEVSRVNALAGIEEVTISPELFKIIEDSIYYSEISNGSFDITVAPQKKGRHEEVLLNKDNLSVRFMSPDIKMDFGGIVKGYAVDRARDTLIAHGIRDALLNIGGNIYAMGNAGTKDGWIVGIQHPGDRNKIIDRLNLKDRAVSTSGNYQRGTHIIDPATGSPAEGIVAVTVVAHSAEEADALSTAIFVMGKEKAAAFIKTLQAQENKDIEVFIL